MPTHDPQFWIVTIITAAIAGWMLWRGVKALRLGKRAKAGKQTHATLTVKGKPTK